MQPVGPVHRPALANVDHVPRFEPLVLADHGRRRVIPIAPRHDVPGDQRLILHQALRLERQRMADGGGGVAELDGNAGEGVTVDAVGGDRFHIAGGGLAERHPPSGRVPTSQGITGKSTRTPWRWKSSTIFFTPSNPPGMSWSRSCWLRLSMPMFG